MSLSRLVPVLAATAALACATAKPVSDTRHDTTAPPPTVPTMSTQDGSVTIDLPEGDGWECGEKAASTPVRIALITCGRKDPAEFFFLMAKVYEVGEADVLPAERLVKEVLPANYAKLFSSHAMSEPTEVRHQGTDGLQVTMDAKHETKGDIKKVEQVFVKGRSVVVLSGEGTSDLFERYTGATQRWLEKTSVKVLD